MSDRTIVIVQYSANLDGSPMSGLLLANGLQEAGWTTHVAFAFDGPVITRFREAGHQVSIIPHKSWLRRSHPLRFTRDVYQEWQSSKAISAYLEQVRPQVVYLNTLVSLAGALAAHRLGIPVVWHIREMFADIGGEMMAPRLVRAVFPKILNQYAAQVVANSKATAVNVMGAAGRHVKVVYNAVAEDFFQDNSDRFSARQQLNLPADKTIIGIPGTLRPMKGHTFFFRAIASLLKERPELMIAVTGAVKDDYGSALQSKMTEQGVFSGRVRFLGRVYDMPAFYHACDVVCIPSEAEPFGRTVVEAFACGAPVVATNVGGIPEIVTSKENGLLVAYGDEQALRSAVCQILDDPQATRVLTENARRKAELLFRESSYQKQLTAIVETVASPHPKEVSAGVEQD